MAAFEQYGFRAPFQQHFPLLQHFFFILRQRFSGQLREFVQVRRQQVGQRHQLGQNGFDSIFQRQAVARSGHQHGIGNDKRHGMTAQHVGYSTNDFRIGQHADFYRVDADVGKHRFALLPYHFGRNGMHALHAFCVLGGNGGNDACAVCTQRAEGFQIGLYARAAAGIGAGNGQNARERLVCINHVALLANMLVFPFYGARRSFNQRPSESLYRMRSCSLLGRPCQNSTRSGITM